MAAADLAQSRQVAAEDLAQSRQVAAPIGKKGRPRLSRVFFTPSALTRSGISFLPGGAPDMAAKRAQADALDRVEAMTGPDLDGRYARIALDEAQG